MQRRSKLHQPCPPFTPTIPVHQPHPPSLSSIPASSAHQPHPATSPSTLPTISAHQPCPLPPPTIPAHQTHPLSLHLAWPDPILLLHNNTLHNTTAERVRPRKTTASSAHRVRRALPPERGAHSAQQWSALAQGGPCPGDRGGLSSWCA